MADALLVIALLLQTAWTPALRLKESIENGVVEERDGQGVAPLASDYYYTHYHAQPLKNWLNDPNGPMWFNGVYHLFFQYNPEGYNWGDMHWYHMTSTDMLHWKHQPVALAPDQPYDCGGIFSGSATIFHNATTGETVPVLTYSVACGKAIVNAFPLDVSDPLLINWTKPSYNPVIPLPPSVTGGFRDPTTAWQGADKIWRLLVGCGDGEGTCQFKSADFVSWNYVGAFHSHGGGMWECPDFYRLPGTDAWVLKASASGDWWTVGTYTEVSDPTKPDKFQPVSGNDIHDGNQKYDFGNFYASKAFYDPPKDRMVLFGWVNYRCNGTDWTGIQTFPRVVALDAANASKIVSYPLPEIVAIYDGDVAHGTMSLQPGATKTVGQGGTQLDLSLQITNDGPSMAAVSLSVRALGTSSLTGGQEVKIGSSASATGVFTGTLNGNAFAITEPALSLRLLVDHSVVEAYAQGGRAVATLPFCPQSAEDGALILTNTGSTPLTINYQLAKVQTANVLPTRLA
jgi:beta-fructofuranosidase